MVESSNPSAVATAVKLRPPTSSAPSGVFDDFDALKLSLEEVGLSGATEVLQLVPVRKPQKHEYFRVRAGDEHCFTTMLYEDKATHEHYFVAPAMIPLLRSIADVSVVTLVQFLTVQGVFGIMPLKIGSDASVRSGWFDTAMAAAEMAKTHWVRLRADMALGGYRVHKAADDLGEPTWPDTPFNELLDIAFRDRVIMDETHPAINKLRGKN